MCLRKMRSKYASTEELLLEEPDGSRAMGGWSEFEDDRVGAMRCEIRFAGRMDVSSWSPGTRGFRGDAAWGRIGDSGGRRGSPDRGVDR
jgi:hypothetical protein